MDKQSSLTKYPEKWDKFVFISSLIGLLFLISINIFKYYYIIPAQRELCSNTKQLLLIKKENDRLKKKIEILQHKDKNEK
jgi:hypothetical protein